MGLQGHVHTQQMHTARTVSLHAVQHAVRHAVRHAVQHAVRHAVRHAALQCEHFKLQAL